MGIRVHKVLGWGLTDVQTNDTEIVDPRFNDFSVVAGPYDEREEKWTRQGFFDWLSSQDLGHDKWLFELVRRQTIKYDFLACFVHGTEYLMPNVLCCVPLGDMGRWYRRDDMLDYYDETCVRGEQTNRVDILQTPIYPYWSFQDRRDGRHIDDAFSFAFRRHINAGDPVNEESDLLAKGCGFADSQECLEFMRPAISPEVVWQLKYGEVFQNPQTLLELQPMIYTFWS